MSSPIYLSFVQICSSLASFLASILAIISAVWSSLKLAALHFLNVLFVRRSCLCIAVQIRLEPLVAANFYVVALLVFDYRLTLLARVSSAFKARPFCRAADHISVDVVVVD